jgi:lipoprotein Spr
MVKKFVPAISIIVFLSSCSALKTLNITSNKQVIPATPDDKQSKFIEDISVTPEIEAPKTQIRYAAVKSKTGSANSGSAKSKTGIKSKENPAVSSSPSIESVSPLHLKYAILLNTEVESLPHENLLEAVDDWYGVRYRHGGSSKSGIDCSAFTAVVYATAFGISIPRVSREQYRVSEKISTTELQEGDLVFFNTIGRGVSHVGIYLGNNKFIHASSSHGVMVSDLFDSYYLRRFIGAGRIQNKDLTTAP